MLLSFNVKSNSIFGLETPLTVIPVHVSVKPIQSVLAVVVGTLISIEYTPFVTWVTALGVIAEKTSPLPSLITTPGIVSRFVGVPPKFEYRYNLLFLSK